MSRSGAGSRSTASTLVNQLWQGQMPARIAVDETVIRTGYGKLWVYAALDPKTHRLLYLDVFCCRDALRTGVFFRKPKEIYGELPSVVLVERWYMAPLKDFGIRRVMMQHGVRNYIERFFKTLKRRLSDFDRYFPCRDAPGFPPYWYWLLVFSWYYNAERELTMPLT